MGEITGLFPVFDIATKNFFITLK